MRTAIVEWDDAFASGTQWIDKGDTCLLKIIPSVAVGVILREDNNSISLIAGINELHYSQAITIPRGCIKRIRYLKCGKS